MPQGTAAKICCQEDFQDFRTACKIGKTIFINKCTSNGFINTAKSSFNACYHHVRLGQDSAKI
jgi:hypothetical protein